MPEARRRPTLAELIEQRRAVPPPPEVARASLAERFLLPPFSVLDARQGYWQKRKRMWLELGIQSELGRGELANNRAKSGSARINNAADGQKRYSNNGLLGESEQARSHYRGANSGMQDTNDELRIDKYRRGRPLATTFGSGGPGDLAAGFRGRGAHPIPGGRTGKNSAYLFKGKDGYRSLKEIQEGNRLTWVAGDRPLEELDEVSLKILEAQPQSGTSIFDPVLCEIAYRWFCPAGGRVLDPFAGGSVRGIVAARLGRGYAGVDLRPEQAEANRVQAAAICPDAADLGWAVGDARDVASLVPGEYDLVFSCPPYADLERYSDDPRDLSTMDYPAFTNAHGRIIAEACAMLRPDRFAVWVVGDVRDRATGLYRGFPADTIAAFRAAGLELYNEAVLVTAVGSLPIRVGKQFARYKKLGKTHQNVLVFVKGDPARAAAACGDVDLDDLELPDLEPNTVAVCAADAAGTPLAEHLPDGDIDVLPVDLPLMEACLLCDVVRGLMRVDGGAVPRVWVAGADGWVRVEDNTELTYLVGGKVYLNRALWPKAAVPVDVPPPPRRLE